MRANNVGNNGITQFLRSEFRQEILKAARPIWEFLRKTDPPPIRSDAIFVFGSDRAAPADKAAKLYHAQYAPKIVVTGGTAGAFSFSPTIPEADKLKYRLIQNNVPANDIVVEAKSANTQENISFGVAALRASRSFSSSQFPSSLILVSLPYQQRRQWATFEKYRQDPNSGLSGIDLYNCPADSTLDSAKDPVSFGVETERMLREIFNIVKYRNYEWKKTNYITWIDIPAEVIAAYKNIKQLMGKV